MGEQLRGSPITELLQRWKGGDEAALIELTPIVYDELRALAQRVFRSERAGHTLQPTAIVNEAYIRLASARVDWSDRQHFFALAARMMRRILVNHAGAKQAAKRGGGAVMVTFDDSVVAGARPEEDVLDIDRGLRELAGADQRKSDILELHYFAGLTYQEAGTALGISEATAKRDLRFAEAWMRKYLSEARAGPHEGGA